VYNLCVALERETSPERIEGTMQDRLAEELVQEMIENEIDEEHLKQQSHVVLPSMSGSLYPFTRASELFRRTRPPERQIDHRDSVSWR